MRLLFATTLAVLALGAPALAQAPPSALIDTSSLEADGDRVMQLSVLVPAPTAQVWTALTTADGWKRLGVGFANVDFRIGGVIETSYSAETTLGARTNIRNEIIAYVPERMLAIRNVQAPPNFPHADEFSRTATVMELEPVGDAETRLTLTATGFQPGPAYDALYAMFRQSNGYTLETLRDSFAAD